MRAQSISEPPSNDRRSLEPGLYMLLKCQKAAVRRKLRDRNPDLFSTFEIFDHAGLGYDCLFALFDPKLLGSRCEDEILKHPRAIRVPCTCLFHDSRQISPQHEVNTVHLLDGRLPIIPDKYII
jgi:hypothetical protein